MTDTRLDDPFALEVTEAPAPKGSVDGPGPGRASRTIRRLAILAFAFSMGSIAFNSVVAPIIHERSSRMLAERLESDLLDGVAPVSNPIEVGTPVAFVDVPRADIRTVVVEGTYSEQLAVAPGHLIGSALPGQPGVAAILGRSATHGAEFAHLDRLGVGDDVSVTTGQGTHVYSVIDVTRRAADDLAAFQGEGHMLILSTLTNSSERLVVRAVLTSTVFPAGEPSNHVTSVDELGARGSNSAWSSLARWLLVGAIVAVAVPWVRRRLGPRVAWMICAPIVAWVVVGAWSALALTGSAAR